MFEVRFVLRYQSMKKSEHVALDIGICILIDCQPARRMLRETDADPLAFPGDHLLDLRCDIDHLLAIA